MTDAPGVSTLKSLTATVFDSAKGYERAAEVADSTHLKNIFMDGATKRRRLAATLNEEIVRLGGEAESDGSVLGAAHRIFLDIANAFERGDEAATERVEEGEDYIEKKFRKALDDDEFTPETRAVLTRAHAEIAEGERMADRLEAQYD